MTTKNPVIGGYHTSAKWRAKKFNYITIYGDLHYCISHKFVYNVEEQERLLYDAKPCHYTDTRFVDDGHNFYKDCISISVHNLLSP